MDFPNKLIRLLRISKRVTALTGTGASQESGLRTFRSETQTGQAVQPAPLSRLCRPHPMLGSKVIVRLDISIVG